MCPVACLLALVAYFYALDGLYIPHIGDEAPYIEIARLTGESGDWLPLSTGPELDNTKPPLLFWVGILSTKMAGTFSLFWLRLPVVMATLLTAAVVYTVARRLSSDPSVGLIAGLSFLGFHSSFQYGRPFLTNLPETLFLFASFSLVLVAREGRLGLGRWGLVGLLLGAACLVKSFALVGPAGLAYAAYGWRRAHGDRRSFWTRTVPGILLASGVALSCFGLWPLFDPAPSAILQHFVLGENVSKLGGDGYLRGLFVGPYPLHRLWLGPFANAGLLAIPVVFVVVRSLRDRSRLSGEEKGLWLYVLAFLAVYSIPSQRQENYLLPVMPALAILLAMRWRDVQTGWLRAFCVPGALVAVALVFVVANARAEVLPPGGYHAWQIGVPVVTALGWLVVMFRPTVARVGFHALVFATLFSLACATAPFESELGRFDPERVKRLEGRVVYVPESFIRRHERHRFLLPGATVEGYDPLDTKRVSQLLESGQIVVMHRSLSDNATGPFRVLGRRLDLRSRLTPDEIGRVVFGGELDLLVRQELIVRRFSNERFRERR